MDSQSSPHGDHVAAVANGEGHSTPSDDGGHSVGQKRLSSSPSNDTEMWEPRGLNKLLRKLEGKNKYVHRGSRCLECSIAKKKCDGGRPCARCTKLAKVCRDQPRPGAQPSMEVTYVDAPPVRPPTSAVFPFPENGSPTPVHSTSERNVLFQFVQFGWRESELRDMFYNLPPSLSRALVLLSDKIGQHLASEMIAPKKPLIPEQGTRLWDGGTASGFVREEFSAAGKNCRLNSVYASLAGVSTEELLSRVGQQDVPLYTTQYRSLCQNLEAFLSHMSDKNTWVYFVTLRKNWLRHNSGESASNGDEFVLVRVTCTFYANGMHISQVVVSPEEYNRATQTAPSSKGRFLECDLPGEALTSRSLTEEETIRNMVKTREGQERLDRLSQRIVELFALDDDFSSASSRFASSQTSPSAAASANASPLAAAASHNPSRTTMDSSATATLDPTALAAASCHQPLLPQAPQGECSLPNPHDPHWPQ